MKKCSKCKEERSFSKFHKNKFNKDGYQYQCKDCKKSYNSRYSEYKKQYYLKNKDRILKKNRQYYENNKEKYIERVVNYNRQYRREKYGTDIYFKLQKRLRNRINSAVRNNKGGSAVKDLGCSLRKLKKYLESKFQPGMSWENYGYDGWHIDHINALANFDLTDREQFLEACNYTNLQPLWAEDNFKKSDKYDFQILGMNLGSTLRRNCYGYQRANYARAAHISGRCKSR